MRAAGWTRGVASHDVLCTWCSISCRGLPSPLALQQSVMAARAPSARKKTLASLRTVQRRGWAAWDAPRRMLCGRVRRARLAWSGGRGRRLAGAAARPSPPPGSSGTCSRGATTARRRGPLAAPARAGAEDNENNEFAPECAARCRGGAPRLDYVRIELGNVVAENSQDLHAPRVSLRLCDDPLGNLEARADGQHRLLRWERPRRGSTPSQCTPRRRVASSPAPAASDSASWWLSFRESD